MDDLSDDCLPYEKEQRGQIAAWKAEIPSAVSKVLNKALSPVSWVVRKIIPKKAIQGALSASNAAGRQLAAKERILARASVDTIEMLKGKQLPFCDGLASWVHNWAIGIAIAEGGLTGAAGIFGAPIDIPAVITLSLWTIHSVGACYGFEARTDDDNQFVLGILAVAGANSIGEKTEALAFLKALEVLIAKQTWKKMAEKTAERQFTREGAIIAIRTLAKQLGINLTKRRALAAVPVVGAFVGAAVNGDFIKDVGWAARRSFQERWLLEKYCDSGGGSL